MPWPYNYIHDLSLISRALTNALAGLPGWLATIIVALASVLLLFSAFMLMVMGVMWTERKLLGRLQVRYGPNRVGRIMFIRCGLLQPVADAIKMLTKEAIRPAQADRWVYHLAPMLMIVMPVAVFAVLPFGPRAVYQDLNIGVLYFIAFSSLSTIVAFMAGWSSSNKYTLISAMRAVAQMVSYEIPMVLSVLGVVLLTGSLQMTTIVNAQISGHVWFVLVQPLGFFIYFAAALAEINRSPLDIIEAESEIVAGYHIEYSGMKFAAFYLAEYANAMAIAGMTATLFFGGWGSAPLLDWLPPWLWFMVKIFFFFGVMVWLRATLPRLRIDQLMGFAWKFLLPLALINLFVTAIEKTIWQQLGTPASVFLPIMAVVNILLAIIFIVIWSNAMLTRRVRATV